jgi:3-hydroxybutyrate dehydrogenase
MRAGENFKHFAAHRRQPLATRRALLDGMRDHIGRTALVIVIRGRKHIGHGRFYARVVPVSKSFGMTRPIKKCCIAAFHGSWWLMAAAAAGGKTMLKGKTALVTGSTSGIGLAYARALAKEGADVMINGFGDAAAIEKERTGIEKEFGVKAIYNGADMTKPTEIAAMVAAAEKTFGRLDILINNAGIQHVDPIENFPIEKWDQIIAINLSSAFHTIRAAIPGMKKRKWGRIIMTASAHSLVASPFKAAYVSAKHGIAGLTKVAALELATFGVTVNCISPGYVWTPLVEKQIPDTMKARHMTAEQVKSEVLLAAQPTKEFVTVDQVASLALYLCSDAAAQITGANLSIDGGWTAA